MEFDFIRILFAFFSGYFLCLSGSLSQLVTNNHLASPSTLGMDGLSVLTIISAQVFLLTFEILLGLEILSLLIFLACFVILYLITTRKKKKNIWKKDSIKNIVLLGLSFNLFVGAIFSILLFLFMAMNYEFPSSIWFGNFKQYQSSWLGIFVLLFLIALVFLKSMVTKLSLLNLGESLAQGLKIDVLRVQKTSLFMSLLLSGVVISFFGVFSFLGLIFPHIIRSFGHFKTSMKNELCYGPIIAGVALSVIDFLCYNYTFMGAELPVGMVSGVLGSFFLIFLVLNSQIKTS